MAELCYEWRWIGEVTGQRNKSIEERKGVIGWNGHAYLSDIGWENVDQWNLLYALNRIKEKQTRGTSCVQRMDGVMNGVMDCVIDMVIKMLLM